ncbi:Uncharacterized protein TCAP_07418, partial [Tolypocladium capitatum]
SSPAGPDPTLNKILSSLALLHRPAQASLLSCRSSAVAPLSSFSFPPCRLLAARGCPARLPAVLGDKAGCRSRHLWDSTGRFDVASGIIIHHPPQNRKTCFNGYDMENQAGQIRQRSASMSQPAAARSSPGLPPRRRFDESWVEVSSQPSSSSLSSIGDEIVTTGLRVAGPHNRRRRLPDSARSLPQQNTIIHAAGTSSQEEYDESESEDDQLMTSSTENMRRPPEEANDDSDADSDDVDNATALGRVSDRPVFQPQPNAFSHPQHQRPQRSHSATYAMPPHPHGGFTRPSFSQRSQTRVHRGGVNFMSPSSAREDNDAALRASLTTLLSCAAAARGLPKTKEEAQVRRLGGDGVGPSNQPMELRLVPESELMEDAGPAQPGPIPSPHTRRSPARSPSRADGASTDKPKRVGSAGRSPRATKKKKTATVVADDALISPTLLTWAVSAGVVVLVSVVGFGAGYVIGREVGRQEALSASVSGVNETTQCGREVIRSSGGGLRRLRWGAVGKSIVAQA